MIRPRARTTRARNQLNQARKALSLVSGRGYRFGARRAGFPHPFGTGFPGGMVNATGGLQRSPTAVRPVVSGPRGGGSRSDTTHPVLHRSRFGLAPTHIEYVGRF